MPEPVLRWLMTVTWPEAAAAFLAENFVIFALVLVLGGAIARRPSLPRVSPPPERVTPLELGVALGNVVLNTLITLVGWQLWRRGVIRFRDDAGFGAAADVVVLLFVMDAAMYALHRVAHARWLYPFVHRYHHRYERVRPLTLFALNPVENLAFGGLWLTVIAFYSASWAGMGTYLVLNVAFGTVGHLGVEPVPRTLMSAPVVRHVAGSSFHAEHHLDVTHNFGFYTLIWDRLFGTLRPSPPA
jgi:sterol desaturase/sphingolipid hydroxylase (fatty acid hydroxylase superfamily)